MEREAVTADKRPQSARPYSLAALLARLQPWQGRLLLLVVAALVVLLLRMGFAAAFNSVEEQAGGIGWTLVANTAPEERFSIVAIDEKSLQEIGPWPWPRETMARLSQRLTDAGVQLQLYDIAFPEAREGDAALAEALANTNAVLSQVPDLQNSGEVIRSGELSHPLSGVSCDNVPQAQNFVGNAPVFSGIAKGHIAPWVDNDGAVRKVPAVVCVDGQSYPAIGISALLQATGAASWQEQWQPEPACWVRRSS